MQKVIVLIIIVLFLYDCATTGVVKSEQESAREEFEVALKSLKDGYYQEAIDKFNQVKAKYPFSRFATESELKIGDTYFEDERYVDAAEVYQEFVKLHPSHNMVDYAAFRVALSYFKDAPGDWFFIPPSYEKDQSSNLKARQALMDFLAHYKGSRYEKEALEYLVKVNQRLIRHDVYIAKFYYKRNKYEATENRIIDVINKFGIIDEMDEALYLLCSALYLQNKDKEFKNMYDKMKIRFPKSKYLLQLNDLIRTKRKG